MAGHPAQRLDRAGRLRNLRDAFELWLNEHPDEGKDHTDIILLTHQTQEKHVDAAIARIEALPTVHGKITRIRLVRA